MPSSPSSPSVSASIADLRFAPYWLDSLPETPVAPPLVDATETDLLVVGGGFTGLWAALQAKEADPSRDVALIDAGRLGHGASGRPGGIVSTSVMHGLANAARLFPNEVDELERLGRENLAGWRATLDRHGIDAETEWGGELTLAVSPEAAGGLAEEHRLHLAHGHDAVLLDRDAARAEIDSPLVHGALWNRDDCGTVHPARLARGLADALRSVGVRVFELSPLVRLERDGAALKAVTSAGSVRARRVLLATNAFAAGDRRIRRRVATVRDRILVTEPLTEAQRAAVGWARRQGAYDTRTQLNYLRLTRDPATGRDRILFGGKLAYGFGGATDAAADRSADTYASLADAFFRTFPQLEGVRFTHAWSGPIALSSRMAVHFQRYRDGAAIWAGGYSGFGVSASRFGARTALALLDGEDRPETRLAFATTLPPRIPPEPFRWIGARTTLHALDTADARGGWRRPWLRFVERLGFPLS